MKKGLTPEELSEFTRRQDRLLASLASGVQDELELVLKRYKALFAQALRKPERDFSGTTAARLAEAEALTEQLDDLLREAGLADTLRRFQRDHAVVQRRSARYFDLVEKPVTLSAISNENLESLVNVNVELLFSSLQRSMVDPLRSALIQGTFASRTPQEIAAQLVEASDGLTIGRADVLVDDLFRRHDRATRNELSESTDFTGWVLFVNPLDNKTSPQCRYMAGEAPHGVPGLWKREEFNIDMHENLTEDPLIAGGHWRCRGEPYELDEAAAREMGAEI